MSRAIAGSTSQPTLVAGSSQHTEDHNILPSTDHNEPQDDDPPTLEQNETSVNPESNNNQPLPADDQPPPDDNSHSGNQPPPSILQAFTNALNMDLAPEDHHVSIHFHPSADKPHKTIPINKYFPLTYEKESDKPSVPPKEVDREPWAPFRTRLDFEVAELALSTHMNRGQINTLLSLLEKCAEAPKSLTLRSATDLEKVWEAAQTCHATSVSNISVY